MGRGAVSEMADKMVSSVMEVLKEHGVEKEKIGVDNLDFPALHAFEKAGLRIVWLAGYVTSSRC